MALMSMASFLRERDGMLLVVLWSNLDPKKCSQLFQLYIAKLYQFLLKEKKIRLFISALPTRQNKEMLPMCSQLS